MAYSLQQAIFKNADKQSKDTVSGYIRNMESLFNLQHIPPLITRLCFLFYYNPEFFHKARKDSFVISDDKLSVTNIAYCGWAHSIYCNKWIKSMSNAIYKWTFKMVEFNASGNIGLGITINPHMLTNDFCSTSITDIPNYAVYAVSGGWKFINGHAICDAGLDVIKNDVVIVTLDLSKRTFSVKAGEKPELIVFDTIEKDDAVRYKMVVQLRSEGDCISLIDFATCDISSTE